MSKRTVALVAGVAVVFAAVLILVESTRDDGTEQVACPQVATVRYSQDELHATYEMTRQMSRPDTAPMWDDDQLRRSLSDPRFVAELEAHLCQMRQSLAPR
jgi:hypothetical protein